MPLKIYHTVAARQDFEDIWNFISADNSRAADDFLRQIMAKIALLAEKPEIGRKRPELGDLRSLPIGRYTLYVRIEGNTLHVVRALSAYRNVTPEMFSD